VNSLSPQHPLASKRAFWHPDAAREGPVWVLFRNELRLAHSVESSRFWWSASQRARVWLNGELISEGPPRSDREQWPYLEVELPAMEKGVHVLAVEVVHYGANAGKGQIGGPGFWLSASESLDLSAWHSDAEGWRGIVDDSRRFWKGELSEQDAVKLRGHRRIGDGHVFDAAVQPKGWREAGFDDANWTLPVFFSETHNNPWGNRPFGCHLLGDTLPRMERLPLDLQSLTADQSLMPLQTDGRHRWVGDAGGVVNAEITLRWAGGKGAKVTLTYCECAKDRTSLAKLRMPDPAKDAFPGQQDRVICDHAGDWSNDWIRSFRYLVVEIELADEPFKSLQLEVVRRGMPLEDHLKFKIEDGRDWKALCEVNRRTIRACSHESFFDCPGWEQAQFSGDSRIQARQHYVAHNEDRLALKAIADLAASRTPSGLLRSHWPSSFEQVISTYSLQWIGMLHDFFWYRGDAGRLKPYLPTARGILAYFIGLKREDGLLGLVKEAPFLDWAFRAGCAPQDEEGGSSILTAMVAEACEWMADLEPACGYPELESRWRNQASVFREALSFCLDETTGLLCDFPGGEFSVHAQVQAALAGYDPPEVAGERICKAMASEECRQVSTLYYRAFVLEALRKSGRKQEAIDLLGVWFDFLEKGVRTWPENDRPDTRSDCHGWGCAPEVEAVHSLFGLEPLEPGWSRIRFQPHLPASVAGRLQLQLPCGTVALERESDGDWQIVTPVPVVRG